MFRDKELEVNSSNLDTARLSQQLQANLPHSDKVSSNLSAIQAPSAINWNELKMTPAFRKDELETQRGLCSVDKVRYEMDHDSTYLRRMGLPIQHVALKNSDVILVDESDIGKSMVTGVSSDLEYRLMVLAAS